MHYQLFFNLESIDKYHNILLIVLLNQLLEFLRVGVFDLSPIFIYLIDVLQDKLKLF